MRVLVVDDDPALAKAVVRELRRHGHDADSVATGREALKAYHLADLVLLDLCLPDMDGLQVCQAIRAMSDVLVIAASERRGELDTVLALQAGADDCLGKPYGVRELTARIEALARRVRSTRFESGTLVHGPLRVDCTARQAWLEDRPLRLTRKEFDLLKVLVCKPNVVFSRKELMTLVWHDRWTTTGRTIDTHVNSLRNKLGDRDWIITVRGVGFRLGGPGTARPALDGKRPGRRLVGAATG
ncbi:response regulator transcription factor [Actinophytocola sp.]|uniref:response regulator transcription factor n=1 Tax=Actinophytocola sp. TaxID=1872138 RepID=UPI00389B3916